MKVISNHITIVFTFFLIIIASYLLVSNYQLKNSINDIKTEISSLSVTTEDLSSSLDDLVISLVDQKPTSSGNVFYIDPINGSSGGDGSIDDPWKSLQEIISSGFIETYDWNIKPHSKATHLEVKNEGAPIKGGATIYLMSGNYGDVKIYSSYNKLPITIKALPNHSPKLSSIFIRSASNWIFENITIDRTGLSKRTLFDVESHGFQGDSSMITLKHSYLTSSRDINNWGPIEWDNASRGIEADATNFTASNNTLVNVAHGISTYRENALIEYNTVNYFSYDAMRGLGNYNTFQYNLITNSINTDGGNHDDGFQSWVTKQSGSSVKGSIVHRNIFIANHSLAQSESSFVANSIPKMQGIGMFNGPFVDWSITDNIIVTSMPHGISPWSPINTVVTGNIVMDGMNTPDGLTPSINTRGPAKSSVPLEGNVIANNVLQKPFTIIDGDISHEGNIFQPNYVVFDLDVNIFKNFASGDFSLTTEFQNKLKDFFGDTVEFESAETVMPSKDDETTNNKNLGTSPQVNNSDSESVTRTMRRTSSDGVMTEEIIEATKTPREIRRMEEVITSEPEDSAEENVRRTIVR